VGERGSRITAKEPARKGGKPRSMNKNRWSDDGLGECANPLVDVDRKKKGYLAGVRIGEENLE